MEEIAKEIQGSPNSPEIESYSTSFKQLGSFSLEIEFVLWAAYTTGGEYASFMSNLLLLIKEKFDQAGISFAFPTQTLHIESLPKNEIRKENIL